MLRFKKNAEIKLHRLNKLCWDERNTTLKLNYTVKRIYTEIKVCKIKETAVIKETTLRLEKLDWE